MLADGIDPIETKHQAKAEAVIKGRTFESVALDWHTEMSAKWAPGHSKTVMSRLKTHVLPSRLVFNPKTLKLRPGSARLSLGQVSALGCL